MSKGTEKVRKSDLRMQTWLYGDNVFEKRGKGRDEAGDREKTRNFNGKTPFLGGKGFAIINNFEN